MAEIRQQAFRGWQKWQIFGGGWQRSNRLETLVYIDNLYIYI